MLKDPMLRWTKCLIIDWISVDLESFKEYMYKIPLTSKQRLIITQKYVPNEQGKVKGFKEIENSLQMSHSAVMEEQQKALKIILDNIGTRLFYGF
jgi:hypothetical protein